MNLPPDDSRRVCRLSRFLNSIYFHRHLRKFTIYLILIFFAFLFHNDHNDHVHDVVDASGQGLYYGYQRALPDGDRYIIITHREGGPITPLRKWFAECGPGEVLTGMGDAGQDFSGLIRVWCSKLFDVPIGVPSPYRLFGEGDNNLERNGGLDYTKFPQNTFANRSYFLDEDDFYYPYFPHCHVLNYTTTRQTHCYINDTVQSQRITFNSAIVGIRDDDENFSPSLLRAYKTVRGTSFKCCQMPPTFFIDYNQCVTVWLHDMYREYFDDLNLNRKCPNGYGITGLVPLIDPWTQDISYSHFECCAILKTGFLGAPPPLFPPGSGSGGVDYVAQSPLAEYAANPLVQQASNAELEKQRLAAETAAAAANTRAAQTALITAAAKTVAAAAAAPRVVSTPNAAGGTTTTLVDSAVGVGGSIAAPPITNNNNQQQATLQTMINTLIGAPAGVAIPASTVAQILSMARNQPGGAGGVGSIAGVISTPLTGTLSTGNGQPAEPILVSGSSVVPVPASVALQSGLPAAATTNLLQLPSSSNSFVNVPSNAILTYNQPPPDILAVSLTPGGIGASTVAASVLPVEALPGGGVNSNSSPMDLLRAALAVATGSTAQQPLPPPPPPPRSSPTFGSSGLNANTNAINTNNNFAQPQPQQQQQQVVNLPSSVALFGSNNINSGGGGPAGVGVGGPTIASAALPPDILALQLQPQSQAQQALTQPFALSRPAAAAADAGASAPPNDQQMLKLLMQLLTSQAPQPPAAPAPAAASGRAAAQQQQPQGVASQLSSLLSALHDITTTTTRKPTTTTTTTTAAPPLRELQLQQQQLPIISAETPLPPVPGTEVAEQQQQQDAQQGEQLPTQTGDSPSPSLSGMGLSGQQQQVESINSFLALPDQRSNLPVVRSVPPRPVLTVLGPADVSSPPRSTSPRQHQPQPVQVYSSPSVNIVQDPATSPDFSSSNTPDKIVVDSSNSSPAATRISISIRQPPQQQQQQQPQQQFPTAELNAANSNNNNNNNFYRSSSSSQPYYSTYTASDNNNERQPQQQQNSVAAAAEKPAYNSNRLYFSNGGGGASTGGGYASTTGNDNNNNKVYYDYNVGERSGGNNGNAAGATTFRGGSSSASTGSAPQTNYYYDNSIDNGKQDGFSNNKRRGAVYSTSFDGADRHNEYSTQSANSQNSINNQQHDNKYYYAPQQQRRKQKYARSLTTNDDDAAALNTSSSNMPRLKLVPSPQQPTPERAHSSLRVLQTSQQTPSMQQHQADEPVGTHNLKSPPQLEVNNRQESSALQMPSWKESLQSQASPQNASSSSSPLSLPPPLQAEHETIPQTPSFADTESSNEIRIVAAPASTHAVAQLENNIKTNNTSYATASGRKQQQQQSSPSQSMLQVDPIS